MAHSTVLAQAPVCCICTDENKNLEIKPITMIYISDIERLAYHLPKKKVDLWDLLKSNYQGSIFPKPFNITLNRLKLNPDYSIAEKKLVDFGVIKQRNY
jgi:hypothetical protein